MTRVAIVADVPSGSVRVFDVDGRSIALANLDGTFYAVDNVCTHDSGPLGEGRLWDGTVECPRHGARFDVKTGAVKALPAVRPVRTYPVQVEGDEVRVDVG
jgi:3-phenylpropionate/trans-cinnamate dioxygenase ferredoxin component